MTLIYAHRCGAGLYPENSLVAIHHSLSLLVDYIDMDVVMNRNHVLMVMHDPFLNRDLVRNEHGQFITNKHMLVKNLSTKKLQTFDIGQVRPGSYLAKCYPEQHAVNHTKIPTLEEAIQFIQRSPYKKQTQFQIEVKANAEHPCVTYPLSQILKQLVNIIKTYKIEYQVEVQSFNWKFLKLLSKQLPHIKTAYLHMNPIPFFKSSTMVFDPIWCDGHHPKFHENSVPKMIRELGGKVWGPHYPLLNKHLVEEAHHYGLKVVPWTIDHPKEMEKLIAYGVDGIITNRPDILKQTISLKS